MKLPVYLARWAPEFRLAAKAVALDGRTELDAALLAAICDRESCGGLTLVPKGPTGKGDLGHGHGLMQIDDRTWAPWLKLTDEKGALLWQVPRHNILKGAQILRQGILATQSVEGGVAAYNCGPLPAVHAIRSLPADASMAERIHALDQKTTGKDYVSWVLAKAQAFREE